MENDRILRKVQCFNKLWIHFLSDSQDGLLCTKNVKCDTTEYFIEYDKIWFLFNKNATPSDTTRALNSIQFIVTQSIGNPKNIYREKIQSTKFHLFDRILYTSVQSTHYTVHTMKSFENVFEVLIYKKIFENYYEWKKGIEIEINILFLYLKLFRECSH